MKTIECLPVSLQASRSFLKEGHLGKAHDKAKALGESHAPVGNIYKICYSSTVKRSRATVEDIVPGIHTAAQYGHSDRGWAGPTTPEGIHIDYLLLKTT